MPLPTTLMTLLPQQQLASSGKTWKSLAVAALQGGAGCCNIYNNECQTELIILAAPPCSSHGMLYIAS